MSPGTLYIRIYFIATEMVQRMVQVTHLAFEKAQKSNGNTEL